MLSATDCEEHRFLAPRPPRRLGSGRGHPTPRWLRAARSERYHDFANRWRRTWGVMRGDRLSPRPCARHTAAPGPRSTSSPAAGVVGHRNPPGAKPTVGGKALVDQLAVVHETLSSWNAPPRGSLQFRPGGLRDANLGNNRARPAGFLAASRLCNTPPHPVLNGLHGLTATRR